METPTFAELPLGPKLQAAIVASGYTTPTPIQVQAIPVAVTGRDVLGIAQTGTGKTASFVLPMIERLETGRARARMPRSLILAPTRELAAQCAQSFEKYGVNHRLNLALLIGGVSFDDQERKLDRGVDVLIATPGRMLDHFQRGKLLLTGVEILVIDEADRMLDMGFIPDIERICKLLPPRRQTLFFSATMPPEIQRLVDTFLKDPARIEVARPATTAKTITQRFRYCPNGEDWAKREVLRELIAAHPVKNAIIFCNRKRDVAILHKSLIKHGFNAGALHGDMDQTSRMATLDKFRNGELMLLAASDVAARGLDIPDVSHVFNFDIPWAGDDYVHRIGRTGRAGREGMSLSLVAPEDLRLIKDIEKVTGEQPVWVGEPPTEADFADSGKRKRRGRGAPGRDERRGSDRREGRGPMRDGPRVRPKREQAIIDGPPSDGPRGDRPTLDRPSGDRPRQDRPRRERQRDDRPMAAVSSEGMADRRERGRDRPRREPRPAESIPGMGEQPSLAALPREGAERQPARHDRQERPQRQSDRPQAQSESRHRPEREQRNDRPHGGRPSAERGERSGERPQRESRRALDGGGQGFADNVPAFLRRPVRPAKAAANE